MSSMHSTRVPVAFAALLAGLVAAALYPAPADAIPAFARKHNLTCTACHTKPPRLNEFGEAFHMAGLQIPMIRDGERHRKRQIGHVWSETDLLNIFAARTHGNFVESVSGTTEPETRLGFPQEVELYLAGTLTEDISYFFVIGGDDDHFGIGHEFHVMANLEPLFRRSAANGGDHDGHDGHDGHTAGGPMIMGPMMMVGKIDPSSFFSYPTNRQLIATIPGQGDHGDQRLALRPYAAASKFFGIETMDGREVEVTRPVLYNTDGDAGVDFHMMIDRFLLQAGVMQGVGSGMRNSGRKVDPYLMARMNFGGERYLSGSVSALAQWGFETARVGGEPVDWQRHGIAANIKYRLLDIYGAAIRDRIRGLPDGIPAFDDEAWGLTVQTDYLLTDPWLLSLRYDYMDAGGFIDERASGRVFTLQARYYFRDSISFWLRDSWNAGDAGANPLQNFRHLIAAGVDLAF